MCDLFNVHAAFGRGEQRNPLRTAIHDHRHVHFFFDVRAIFDKQAAHLLTGCARLMRDELHAEDLAREFAHLLQRFRDLYAAAFATTTRMNLRFDDPHRTA